MTPTLTRDRRALLDAVRRGRVSLSNGMVFRAHGTLKTRCERRIRELEDAGWVALGTDGFYELTDAGRAVLDPPCVNCDDPACRGCWGADTHIVDDWRP